MFDLYASTELALLAVFLFSAIPLFLTCKIYLNKYHSSHLLTIPGPQAAAFTRYWRAWQVSKGHFERDIIALHETHGPLVRLAPDVVSVSDPKEVRNIYGQDHKFIKSAFYPLQSITWKRLPAFNLFSTQSPAQHRLLSRQVGAVYSLTSILQSESALDMCLDLFIGQLSKRAGQALDLGCWIQYLTFDAMGEFTFAGKFGFLELGGDIDGIIESISSQAAYSAIIGQVPQWHPWLLGNWFLGKLMKPLEDWNATLLFCVKAMRSRSHVKEGQVIGETDTNGVDMVSKWSRVKPEEPHKMKERDLMVALSANIFAGSDTISIACKSIIFQLCRNRSKMEKLVAEVLQADADGLLSRRVSYREVITHLPYTCAAIKEGQRMHPSFGLILERICPPEGAIISQRFIPGGTTVGMSPWVFNYDPKNFVEPESFVPERWLENADDDLKGDENILAFNFGHGVRGCAGKNIAQVELHKIVAELFRRFDVQLKDPQKKLETQTYWFAFQGELPCILKPR